MRSMCGAGAGCSAINYQSLLPLGGIPYAVHLCFSVSLSLALSLYCALFLWVVSTTLWYYQRSLSPSPSLSLSHSPSFALSLSRQVIAVSNVLLTYSIFKNVPRFFFGFLDDRYGLYPSPCTLYLTPSTLHPTTYTLLPTPLPCTLHPAT